MKNNNTVIEISNRIETSDSNGCGGCGPFCSFCVVAETVYEVNGRKVYLTSSWIDMAPEEIEEEITSESIFDTMLMSDDEVERLDELRGEHFVPEGVPYRECFDRMQEQIVEKLREVDEDEDVINMLLGIETEEDYDDEDEDESSEAKAD